MSESGIAIDPDSKTVLLIGEDIIHRVFQRSASKYTLRDFNKIAQAIVHNQGAAYGAYLNGVDDDEWCLGCVTQEDSITLTRYLEDPSAEVHLTQVEHDLIPNKSPAAKLH
ncbi:hypothetical protein ST201phi2-1p058 [Pseudomonas phage 201phi2-1]|uniref:Uncharacterized protein n=1 Tax=Pseudomonas phage 201phi2-1 TaxID=198110 RepID=B3FK33_BP201|nr:hypothetical protein ST201phi2-1p058 [Pseudomonas phage 201phi2-1]ABY62891.1 hypothetical protein 201phi2-1p058 [Pseudomonas phage 201phi2-1]